MNEFEPYIYMGPKESHDVFLDFALAVFHELAPDHAPYVSLKEVQDLVKRFLEQRFKTRNCDEESNWMPLPKPPGE